MRKIPLPPVLIVAAVFLAMGGTLFLAGCSKKENAHVQSGQEMVYHCPMHPNYLSHQPGNCPICGMNLVPVHSPGPQKNSETGKGRVLYYRDAMNPSFTSDKPGKAPDGMDLVAVYEGEGGGNGVRIDPAMIQSIGVQTEKAALRTLVRDIRTSATIMPDERRATIITTKIMGYAEKLYVNYTGQRVTKGEPLYDVYSPDLVSAQSEYLQALHADPPADSSKMVQSARQRLLNWDITEAQIAAIQKRGTPEKTITVVSPASGTITEKMIVEGQNIEPGMKLYKVVDYSRLWVEAAVYQQDVPLVKIGQQGTIELDYYPGEKYYGTITYIAPELSRDSKTLLVRLELPNSSSLKIKPGMNAAVTLHSVAAKKAITVPDQAVIRSGARTLVVIAKGGGYFEPREIKTGQSAQGYTEIIEGVQEGEEIVTSSQFLIDSESNLKAAILKMGGNKGNTIPVPKTEAPVIDSTKPEMKGMKGM